jgi:hypothetical protein
VISGWCELSTSSFSNLATASSGPSASTVATSVTFAGDFVSWHAYLSFLAQVDFVNRFRTGLENGGLNLRRSTAQRARPMSAHDNVVGLCTSQPSIRDDQITISFPLAIDAFR